MGARLVAYANGLNRRFLGACFASRVIDERPRRQRKFKFITKAAILLLAAHAALSESRQEFTRAVSAANRRYCEELSAYLYSLPPNTILFCPTANNLL
jgi:hypothetical protein